MNTITAKRNNRNNQNFKKNSSQQNEDNNWLQKEIKDIKEMGKDIKEGNYELSLEI